MLLQEYSTDIAYQNNNIHSKIAEYGNNRLILRYINFFLNFYIFDNLRNK